MDTETMRRVLAEGMGWIPERDSHENEWFLIPAVGVNGPTYMLASNWAPWESWPQCGLVIEAMREKGWRWEVEDGYENGLVRVTLTDARGNGPDVFDEDERYARMLAAARALEATDE